MVALNDYFTLTDAWRKKGLRRGLADAQTTSDDFFQKLMGLQRPDTANFLGGIEGDIGKYQAAGLDRFFGPEYEQAIEQQIMAQGAPQAQAAARLASHGVGGRGGAAFGGGIQEQLRRAQTDLAPIQLGAIAQSRAQAEQGRAGIAQQSAQSALQARTGARTAGLGADQSTYQALLQAISSLGGQTIGARSGLQNTYLGGKPSTMGADDLAGIIGAIAALLFV